MSISFDGIGHRSVTFPVGTCTVGFPCKLDTEETVSNCAASGKFLGVVEEVKGGYAGVQLHGFVTLPYTGTAPTVGFTALSANGTGGVKVDTTNGKTYLVVHVNKTATTVTFEL